MNRTVETEARRIADEIVALVERTDGPVTFHRVEREVSGFGASEPPYRDFYSGQAGRPVVWWSNMSEAGAQALKNVLLGNRIAVEMVNALPYILEGGGLADDAWQPLVLLPAKQANVSAMNGLFRVPEELLAPGQMLPSWKVLKPGTVSGTAH